jgi:hypothetical protein
MDDWQRVELSSTDSAEEVAEKVLRAMAAVHELLAGVMIWYRDKPYVALVPPDAGLAWARAGESQRLSRIATESAGLGHVIPDRPGSAVDRDPS